MRDDKVVTDSVGSKEVAGITQFVDRASNDVFVRNSNAVNLKELYTDSEAITNITNYFSRPKVLANLTYSQLAPSLVNSYDITNAFIQSNVYNFARAKGAFGYRATVCFKLQAINTPFQAGRLRLAFQPFFDSTYHVTRYTAICPVSQLPGVEMDLEKDNAVELRIPFIHPLNYFEVNNTNTGEDLGTLAVYAYTPKVNGVGVPDVTLALWMWLEDVELVAAAVDSVTQYDPQSGTFQKKGPAAQEEQQIEGNLSNVLMAGSKVTKWVGERIPLLSAYTGVTSWMAREAAKVAASYGWSKPVDTSSNAKRWVAGNIYQHNADGPDSGYNTGAFADNSVMIKPGFAGTDIDEMSIDYIKSVYSAVNVFNVSINDTTSTVLYGAQCCPLAMWFQNAGRNFNKNSHTTGRAIRPSSIFGLSNLFRYYRGGLRFKFKIAKTRFHTGRLIIGFNPEAALLTEDLVVPTDPLNMNYKSHIWDLRDCSEVEFDAPFINPQSYLRTNEHYGAVFVAVLEPLQGPDTVAATVPIIVEVCGMADFEVAVPTRPKLLPAPTNSQVVFQSGGFEPFDANLNEEAAALCIGERIKSVKQLCSMALPVKTVDHTFSFLYNDLELNTWVGGPLTPTDLVVRDASYGNYWRNFYGLFRGGIVGDSFSNNDKDDLVTFLRGTPSQEADWTPLITSGNGSNHARLPYYSRYMRSINGTAYYKPEECLKVFTSTTSNDHSIVLMKRTAEDFQLGYYLGCPTLTPRLGESEVLHTEVFALTTANRTPV